VVPLLDTATLAFAMAESWAAPTAAAA
jgi:hypothetical protein